MSGDDDDVRSGRVQHLPVVVEQGVDAEALAEVGELVEAAIDAGHQLQAIAGHDRLGMVVGKVGKGELVAHPSRTDERDAQRYHKPSLVNTVGSSPAMSSSSGK